MIEVPSKNDVKTTAKTGAVAGGAVGLGELLGRGVLGPGLGTAAGGLAAASSMSGNERTTGAMLAVERGFHELTAGGGGNSGGGSSQGVK